MHTQYSHTSTLKQNTKLSVYIFSRVVVETKTLEPNVLSSNPAITTYTLCDPGKVTSLL